jgi:hypothetical protein
MEVRAVNPELHALITAAILAHNSSHPGEFLDCVDTGCEELRIDLLECVRTELLLAALREGKVAA